MRVPEGLFNLRSIFISKALATMALKDFAPLPKSILLYNTESPLSIYPIPPPPPGVSITLIDEELIAL